MNLTQHPELLEQLAASHALGTLRGGARRRFEALARDSAVVRTQALLWQERLASLTELTPSEAPSPNVWKRIAHRVALERRAVQGAQTAQAKVAPAEPARARWRFAWPIGAWRGAAIAGAVASVAGVVVGMRQHQEIGALSNQLALAGQDHLVLAQKAESLSLQNAQLLDQVAAQPDIAYVAVLADGKAQAAMLVTLDARQQSLQWKSVAEHPIAPNKSLQLWALPTDGTPTSLGVLGERPAERFKVNVPQLSRVPALAVSLEPKGGVAQGGPTGPVLFSGRVLTTR